MLGVQNKFISPMNFHKETGSINNSNFFVKTSWATLETSFVRFRAKNKVGQQTFFGLEKKIFCIQIFLVFKIFSFQKIFWSTIIFFYFNVLCEFFWKVQNISLKRNFRVKRIKQKSTIKRKQKRGYFSIQYWAQYWVQNWV